MLTSCDTAGRSQQLPYILAATGSVCLAAAAFFAIWHGRMPLEGVVQRLAHADGFANGIDGNPEGPRLAADLSAIRKYYALTAAFVLGCAGMGAFLAIAWRRSSERVRRLAWKLGVTLACTCSLMVFMSGLEFEGQWMPMNVMMNNPTSLHIVGHRLLFIWIARAIRSLTGGGLSNLRSFYASQIIAAFLAMYALGRWSALIAGEALSWVGQVMGCMILASSFSYYTFHDIGIVFFSTCGMIAIYTRRYWWLVPVVAVGTLNHEGVLLVLPVCVFVAFGQDATKKWLAPVAAATVAYILVRSALLLVNHPQTEPGLENQLDLRVWSNMVKPFLFPKYIVQSFLTLLPWCLLGLVALRHCDIRIQKMAVLFHLLVAVTVVFGQFHEARQFDAGIPVMVGIILNATARQMGLAGEEQGRAPGHATAGSQ